MSGSEPNPLESSGKNGRGGSQEAAPQEALELQITDEPLEIPDIEPLPEELQARAQQMIQAIQEKPGEMLPHLLHLVREYPRVPALRNWLVQAYRGIGDGAGAEAGLRELLEVCPRYLHARIQMAFVLLEREQVDEIPALFGKTFNLRRMYPERQVFHITEVLQFYHFYGCYLLHQERLKEAHSCLRTLDQLAPADPLTRDLAQRFMVEASHVIVNGMQKAKEQLDDEEE